MQIGGSITAIERLRRGCRIRDPDSRWTNFARVGFNEAGKQYSENELNGFGGKHRTDISGAGERQSSAEAQINSYLLLE